MEHYMYSSDEDANDPKYALHNAAEAGDVELLKSLLEKKPSEFELPTGEGGVPIFGIHLGAGQPLFDVDLRDDDNCTPLHLAILNGHVGAVEVILQNEASVTRRCEGSPPLHMAVCAGSLPNRQDVVIPMVRLLLSHGAVAYDRDDHGRTALHWAAYLGLTAVVDVLLESSKEFVASQKAAKLQAAAASDAPNTTTAEDPEQDTPPLIQFQDKQNNTALHLAARYNQPQALSALLHDATTTTTSITDILKQKNKQGLNVLHTAALGGNVDCVRHLVQVAPALLTTTNRQGLTAASMAARRGHTPNVVQLLTNATEAKKAAVPVPHSPSTLPSKIRPMRSLGAISTDQTALIAPPECLEHHTAVFPFQRGVGRDVPPENRDRLSVLTKPGYGILRTTSFDGQLVWDEKHRKAALGDILRVHDWAYVRRIQNVCDKIADSPSAIGQLDGDTAVSHRSYAAALAAAGAVCHAVDEVLTGKVKNAFCAVRPPGHHAGPSGVVAAANDPSGGSHGFCLFNNVAIGAAYAMTVHRHLGIKRTAILDFDVHHGNGTEACVANTAPSVEKYVFKTPFGEGAQQFPVYKPWHDVDDKDNIFFASVQGYGSRAPGGVGGLVYPGSGATCDTREVGGGPFSTATVGGVEPVVDAQGGAGGDGGDLSLLDDDEDDKNIEEDPDHEFSYKGGEMPRVEGPRIIDVGIPGPGSKVALWRRAWRDKIIPALVKFNPDLILISAGFDAHKKEEINFHYIGVQEKDYEWLTEQLVQVANRCCEGRIVSVLEGGYRIQGAVVSAFARSVAAHVQAMAEVNHQTWDARDAKWEREHEKALRAEAEAKRQAAMQAEWARMNVSEVLRDGGGGGDGGDGTNAIPSFESPRMVNIPGAGSADPGGADAVVPLPHPSTFAAATGVSGGGGGADVEMNEAGVGGSPEGSTAKKRRRGATVDYIALNKKLEEEAKAKAAGGQ